LNREKSYKLGQVNILFKIKGIRVLRLYRAFQLKKDNVHPKGRY
jgi:hypothetical protein